MPEEKVLILTPSPCNMIIASPTNGGKSTFAYRLIRHDLFQVTPEKILYCFNSTWQSLFSRLESEMPPDRITFHQGLPTDEEIENFIASTPGHKLIILDDLMLESTNSLAVLHLFTVAMHHDFCSVMLLTHNLFPKSKHSRTLALNTQVFVVMSNSRDRQQIQLLGRQLGYKRLLDAYTAATSAGPYNHLMIDLHNNTPNHLRLRSRIFPDDDDPTSVYKAE
jgi:hypothetical protein